MSPKSTGCFEIFKAKGAGEIYSELIARLQKRVGRRRAVEDPKQTCVHVVAGTDGVAYAGIHPRKGAVLVNVRCQSPINSKRIRKAEQVSRNRCHCEVLVEDVKEVNAELLGWLEEAAKLVENKAEKRPPATRRLR